MSVLLEQREEFFRPRLNPLPENVMGVKKCVLSLNGCSWRLGRNVEENCFQKDADISGWENVKIPVQPALEPVEYRYAYSCEINIPRDWELQRVFLRFDGANGIARVYVDGIFLKEHYGSFISWDCEITECVNSGGKHRLTVVMEDKAGELSTFNYGGLVRDVSLYAVPRTYLTRLHADTVFDSTYTDAKLKIYAGIFGGEADIVYMLQEPSGKEIMLGTVSCRENQEFTEEYLVERPLKWDCEHPNLYQLKASVNVKGKTMETITRKIGFRQIERRGRNIFVNGDKIKLHGVNHHDTYPLTNRVLTHELVEKDIKLFKEANVNFIRTSHYPARIDFLELCDEYGIYVEDEASISFLGYASRQTQNDPEFRELFLQNFSEMIERDYSHPCILIWSLANESHWGANFALLNRYAHWIDTQRQTIFSFPIGQHEDDEQTDIWSAHYVAYDSDFASRQDALGRSLCISAEVPVLHDECTHVPVLEAQDIRREPGIRDFWGGTIANFWNKIWETDGALGAAIWAGVDNTLVQNEWMTGQSWGIIDGWRRRKPEYWHVRKAYSPIRVLGEPFADGAKTAVMVHNRFLHTDMSQVKIEWKAVGDNGSISGPKLAPFEEGKLLLPVSFKEGESLELRFYDSLGRQVEEVCLRMGNETCLLPKVCGGCPIIDKNGHSYLLRGEEFSIAFSKETGLITEGRYGSETILTGGPYLHLTGLELEPWELEKMEVLPGEKNCSVVLDGSYGRVRIRFCITVDITGMMETEYTLKDMPFDSPRRVAQTSSICNQSGGYDEVGIAYQTAKALDELTWHRKGMWTVYPEWHMSRLQGRAFRDAGHRSAPEIIQPDWEWKEDEKDTAVYSQYDICGRGSRDFSGMKTHILQAALQNEKGAFRAFSNAADSVRMIVEFKRENIFSCENPAIRYHGTWTAQDTAYRSLNGTEMYSSTSGDSCELTFRGTGIGFYSGLDTICGTANIYIDGQLKKEGLELGVPQAAKNARSYTKYYRQLVFSVQNLPYGEHVIKVEVTGDKSQGSFNSYVNIDYFVVLDKDPIGDTRFVIDSEYNYTRLSWGVWEKPAVNVQTGYCRKVYTQIGPGRRENLFL